MFPKTYTNRTQYKDYPTRPSEEPITRPSFEYIYMQLAKSVSKRSTCQRRQVGTVITSADYRQVFSLGYNGNYRGGPNHCSSQGEGVCGCLHSEINAIINCGVVSDRPKHVFVTVSPCGMCAKALVNLGGVKHVFYSETYRKPEGIDILKRAGIKCTQIT